MAIIFKALFNTERRLNVLGNALFVVSHTSPKNAKPVFEYRQGTSNPSRDRDAHPPERSDLRPSQPPRSPRNQATRKYPKCKDHVDREDTLGKGDIGRFHFGDLTFPGARQSRLLRRGPNCRNLASCLDHLRVVRADFVIRIRIDPAYGAAGLN